jgi:hypothetical protein
VAPKDPRNVLNPQGARQLEEARERGQATEISFATRPVTFTAAIAAAVLLGISQFA